MCLPQPSQVKRHIIWEMGQPLTLTEKGHPCCAPKQLYYRSKPTPLALWPSLGHQMTPVVASPEAKASHPHPVVRSHLIFHRTQAAGSIHRDQQMLGGKPQNGFLLSWPCGFCDGKPLSLKTTTHNTIPYTFKMGYASMKCTFSRLKEYFGQNQWQVNVSHRLTVNFDCLVNQRKLFFSHAALFGPWMGEREKPAECWIK